MCKSLEDTHLVIGADSTFFMHKRGVRQGCIYLVHFYLLYLLEIWKHICIRDIYVYTYQEGKSQIHTLMFADIAIVALTPHDVQLVLNALIIIY